MTLRPVIKALAVVTCGYIVYNIANMVAELPRFKVRKLKGSPSQPRPGLAVSGKIWLEKDGELYIGGGRAMLLERIEQYGSIAAAARSMNLAYRNAWLWVEAMNRLAPRPLVEIAAGGVGGRHARLTEEGWKVLNQYKELRARFQEFLNQVSVIS